MGGTGVGLGTCVSAYIETHLLPNVLWYEDLWLSRGQGMLGVKVNVWPLPFCIMINVPPLFCSVITT